MNNTKLSDYFADPEWECQLFGGGEEGIVFRPKKGHHPNLFWRWMQFILLGNKWRKINKVPKSP